MLRLIPLALAALLVAPRVLAQAPRLPAPGACRAAPRDADAAALLARAIDVMGVAAARDRHVLRFAMAHSASQAHQSDRSYPPFFEAFTTGETWLDPRTGVERSTAATIFPGSGTGVPARTATSLLVGASGAVAMRDTLVRAAPQNFPFAWQTRLLDPWAVVIDWASGAAPNATAPVAARVAGTCEYRDYPRLVVERTTPAGLERLFVDPKSGYPVKLEYDERHFLWGQVRIEYVWSTWITPTGGAGAYPAASFRLEDGRTTLSRTVGTLALVPRDSAPALGLTAAGAPLRIATWDTLASPAVDTVRVGPTTFLLVNRAYTETVTQVGDTVYLLDATLGESRARQDSAWIARLFPRARAVALVVTDLAWPHIGGVRWWAARGATIYTHTASRAFLTQVLDRRWTAAPDLFERTRATRRAPRLVTLRDSLSLAGGALRLYPIDGPASEGALMAWLPGDAYLWASDFVQDVSRPTQYGREVVAAVRRVGVAPKRLAAEHLGLTEWGVLEAVVR